MVANEEWRGRLAHGCGKKREASLGTKPLRKAWNVGEG
jgi:hypothetical protein